ncbi:MAG TPA: hypothetical protein DEG71_00165, partial [Clostridiales bacterium]|nr:hypothetical protein [Clostridiales bacterium]
MYGDSKEDAKLELRKKEYLILDISRDISTYFNRGKHTKLTSSQITDIFSNIALLLKVDISLSKAINMIAERQKNEGTIELLLNVSKKIRMGIPFSQVLRDYKLFDELTLALIKVGEESGKLADACDEVCKHYADKNDISKKLKGALIYPIATILVGLIAIYGISVKVVPIIFDSMGEYVETNLVTDILLLLSNFFQKYNIIPIVIFVLIIIVLKGYMKRNHKKKLDQIVMSLPYVGEYLRKIMTINFVKTYALLYRAGVNAVDIVIITKGLSDNQVYKDNMDQVIKGIKKGEMISEHLSEDIYGSTIINM